jgi:hypothetical protein
MVSMRLKLPRKLPGVFSEPPKERWNKSSRAKVTLEILGVDRYHRWFVSSV